MKVTRGRTFELEGVWEKVEVELTTDDLLPEESAVEAHLRPLLLEIRADQQIVSFAHRLGSIDDVKAREASDALKAARRRVLGMSKASLPARLVT